ncbi:hypothetical protein [Wolbachia endosymbiont (group A) of Cydia splendana]|nr:hypothetical protein [Wolbachia endosymbiont (group A) of Cydia splendana]
MTKEDSVSYSDDKKRSTGMTAVLRHTAAVSHQLTSSGMTVVV